MPFSYFKGPEVRHPRRVLLVLKLGQCGFRGGCRFVLKTPVQRKRGVEDETTLTRGLLFLLRSFVDEFLYRNAAEGDASAQFTDALAGDDGVRLSPTTTLLACVAGILL